MGSEASGGNPPCGRCAKDNRECILGTSNRGGRRERKKKPKLGSEEKEPAWTNETEGARQEPLPQFSPPQTYQQPTLTDGRASHAYNENAIERHEAASPSGSINSGMEMTMPTNASDTWQSLKDVGARNPNGHVSGAHGLSNVQDETLQAANHSTGGRDGVSSYRLIREELLLLETVVDLVADFRDHFHDYLPLVPKHYYQPDWLDYFATTNKHLFTAVLTIASKVVGGSRSYVHETCCNYMQHLIAGLAAGADCGVEAVEALLLLAEWVPQGLRASGEATGRGEEDRTAWMHIGMALRIGYYLGLDRTSFRNEDAEEHKSISRRRLAWTCCYISDRLVSCRIGKAFWSRGPGPMTGLSSRDFPSLQPSVPGDEDHARVFKAILDLTQIYSNVHDILYTATKANNHMILLGDYVKYIDEFRSTISRWNEQWGSLLCSPHIKVTLDLSYHYLQLYTNAFAFQAAISQALVKGNEEGRPPTRDDLRKLFDNIGRMQDARFILKSIEAAKQYLVIFNTYVSAHGQLLYMPIRFYLYCIYCAVFLYKARMFSALHESEEKIVPEIIAATVKKLKDASVSPNDTGRRYARLLELLWQKARPSQEEEDLAASHLSRHATTPTPFSPRPSEPGGNGLYDFSPTNGFSWLDLGGTADYISEQYTYAPQPVQGTEYGQQFEDFADLDLNWPF